MAETTVYFGNLRNAHSFFVEDFQSDALYWCIMYNHTYTYVKYIYIYIQHLYIYIYTASMYPAQQGFDEWNLYKQITPSRTIVTLQ